MSHEICSISALVSWKNGALACDKLFTVGLERFFFLTVGFSLINLIFTIKELIYELEVWHHQRLFRTNGNLNIRTSYTRLKLDYLLVHSGTLGYPFIPVQATLVSIQNFFSPWSFLEYGTNRTLVSGSVQGTFQGAWECYSVYFTP